MTTSVVLLVAIHISSSVLVAKDSDSASLIHAEQVAGGMEILTKLGNRLKDDVPYCQNVSSSEYKYNDCRKS